jgi:hypothetical protein
MSLSVAGCGRSGRAPDSAASLKNSNESPSVASSRGESALSGPSGGAPATAAPAAADEMARSESERPGLGTSWGEAVSSQVSSTSFYRQSDSSPDGIASLFYNDEAGVSAMSHGRFVDYGDSVVPLVGGRITVSIVDASGSPLRAAHVAGRTIALGSDGDRYIVRVDNRSPVRIEAVATVDGLDVIDGQDGSLHKRGYVIAPYDTLDIEGFRESEGSVRAFRFGSVSDSYAARRGKDRNVGVVGVAVFREQGSDFRWSPEELDRRETADPFPSHFAPPPPSYRGY